MKMVLGIPILCGSGLRLDSTMEYNQPGA